jgi:dTDP-4-amino-4,6-dideoxygalactose transaminase
MTPDHPIRPMDPLAGYVAHREEIDAAIRRVLEGGRYILGAEVAAFEREFATYLGAAHAVGVGNGTEALHLALPACGVGPGDRVVTVSHTAVATVAAIRHAGAIPVLVDVDPGTYTLDPARLEEALRPGGAAPPAKAVVPVHLYGHPADMTSIVATARRFGARVIEDAAQAHGAMWHGRRAGTLGDVAAFSFYPTKNLGALGDGGAVVTDDPAIAERMRRLREYGWRERYVSETEGWNSRLDEIQAAVLRVKLRHLDAENARRRAIATLYDEALGGTSLVRPRVAPSAVPVFHQYVVRSAARDALIDAFSGRGVRLLIHYPEPVHRQPAYRDLAIAGPAGLSKTEEICREIVSLPMHPYLTDEQVRTVADWIGAWDRAPARRS